MKQAVIHIVDDDSQVRASTSFLLRSLGYHAEVYSDGREFLDYARLRPADCILLDLRMPGLGGLDVQEELRARGVQASVVMLSGHGDISIAVQAMRLGAVDFLEKPYSEESLTASVRRAVEHGGELAEASKDSHQAREQVARLSRREREVLQGLLAGMISKQIAHHLGLSTRTVDDHRCRLVSSLEVRTSAEAVRIAVLAGLEPLAPGDGSTRQVA